MFKRFVQGQTDSKWRTWAFALKCSNTEPKRVLSTAAFPGILLLKKLFW